MGKLLNKLFQLLKKNALGKKNRDQNSNSNKSKTDPAKKAENKFPKEENRAVKSCKNVNKTFVDKLLDNPKSIWGKSPEEIQKAFQNAGYKTVIEQSTKGSKRSIQIRVNGHPTISNIQVHPGGGRHGGAYYKLSTSTQGKIKVVDRATYKPTPGEKAKILYKD